MIKNFKSIFIVIATLMATSSCKEDNNYKVDFKNDKDEISYIWGVIKAKTIVFSKIEPFQKLDKELLIKGFKSNLNGTPAQECLGTLELLFGKTGQDFNAKYLKKGSNCMGRLTAYAIYYDIRKLGALSDVNFKMIEKGFEDGVYKKDTLFLKDSIMRLKMKKFMVGLNVKYGKKMMDNAKKIKGAQIFENGLIMQTITEGKGPNPDPVDDVMVHYILTSALGDTIQNSYKGNGKGLVEPIPLSLSSGVIPGWSFALPKMKVGGKYRIYVPWNLAYGEQFGRESLCFLIELIARGKTGTLVKTPIQSGK